MSLEHWKTHQAVLHNICYVILKCLIACIYHKLGATENLSNVLSTGSDYYSCQAQVDPQLGYTEAKGTRPARYAIHYIYNEILKLFLFSNSKSFSDWFIQNFFATHCWADKYALLF